MICVLRRTSFFLKIVLVSGTIYIIHNYIICNHKTDYFSGNDRITCKILSPDHVDIHYRLSHQRLQPNLYYYTYLNRNNSRKPYIVSFKMGWQDISKFYHSVPLGINTTQYE